jgi:membrane-associated phospholipid phosphatase
MNEFACRLIAILLVLSATGFVHAQETPEDTQTKQDPVALANAADQSTESSKQGNVTGAQQTAPVVAPGERNVTEKTFLKNFLQDQKDMWLFPAKFSQENHWAPTLVVAGATGVLIGLDQYDTPYFRRTTTFGDFNRAFSTNITMTEVLAVPVAFYGVGLLTKDPYARKTGLLAAEAVADVSVLAEVFKGATRQLRPQAIRPNGNFADSFGDAQGDPFSSSFPSGHTIDAFAVATVIANRYGRHRRWVPFLAFGAATVIGFSRVTTREHFPSDVFFGAALGYAVAQFDVLRMPGFALTHRVRRLRRRMDRHRNIHQCAQQGDVHRDGAGSAREDQ